MRINGLWWAIVTLVGLAGCSPQTTVLPALPIAIDRPTLFFFYTDG
jgi:hypothetical protein